MYKKKYSSALQDKRTNRRYSNNKINNNNTNSSIHNKFLYVPLINTRRRTFFHISAIDFKPNKNKITKLPQYIHKRATEYKLHPFRDPNLKIIGEDIKNQLLEKNKGILKNKNTKPKIITDNNKRKISLKIRNSSGASEFVLGRRSKAESRISSIVRNIKNGIKFERKSVKFDTTSKILKYRVLIRRKNLYDSNDDDESDDDKGFAINPEQKIFILYDFFILAFFIYNFIFSTTDLCLDRTFCPMDNKFSLSDIILFINDILYIIDLILSFFRSYYNFEYKLIKSNSLILKHFLKYNFIFDLLSAIPVFSISKYQCLKGNNNFQNYKYEIPGFIIVLRLCSILKVLKIKKIINSHDKNQALDKLIELTSNNYTIEKIVSIIITSLIYISILHCIVCIHIFLGKNSYSNWLILTNAQNESLGAIYIKSLYFIISTLTTVGYGDIVCISFYERIYQIIILIIGSILYPYIISSIGHFVKKESNARIHLENDLAMLETIRRDYPNIPYKLYNAVYKYFDKKSTAIDKCDFNSFIESLPFSLKNQILFTRYETYVSDFKFFKRNNNSVFIAEVLNKFIPSTAKKNEFLIYEGELVEEIIFIKDGKISFNAAINSEEPLKSINNYFLERFTPFTNEEEDKLLDENLNNISYFSQLGEISYDKTKHRLSDAFKNFTNTISGDNKNNIQIAQNIEVNNYNYFDIKGGAIINDEGNYHYLKILDIRKNEHFGCVFVTLNKPCPLSLQVKSKFAELFLLKKAPAVALSRTYPNIWKKLYGREYLNMMKIKKRTFSILTKYIELNELLINNSIKDIINSYELTSIDLKFLEKANTTGKSPKNRKRLNSIISQEGVSRHHTVKNKYGRKRKTKMIENKIRKHLKTKIEKNIKIKRNSTFTGLRGTPVNLMPYKRHSKSGSNFFNKKRNFETMITKKITHELPNENKIETMITKKFTHELPNENKINNSFIINSNIKKKKKSNKEKLKELKSFLKLSKKFFDNNNEIKSIKDSPGKNHSKNKESNKKENTEEINKIDNNNKKIDFESDIDKDKNLNTIENSEQLLKVLKNMCKEETDFSFCSMNKENNFHDNKLSIEKNSNFEILSVYQNANEISKGKYINDINFQNKLKLIIKNHYLHKHKESLRDDSLSLRAIAFSSGFESCNYKSENERRKYKLVDKNIDKSLKHKNTIKVKKDENNLKNENNINKIKNREKKFENNQQRKGLTKIQTMEDKSKTYISENNNFCNDFPDLKLKNNNLIVLNKNEEDNSNSIKVNKSKTSSAEKYRSEFIEKPYSINIRKNINICNNKELEFIIDKEIDKNVRDENFLTNNKSNLKHNIKIMKNRKRKYYNHDSSIYDDKNNQIINQMLGIQLPHNILANNIISGSPEKKDNFYNSVGKIKNIDASVNIYNIIQKNFDNNEKDSPRKKSFCNLF